MKKTSIFLTAALIVVAILAGCSDSVAITGLPQSVKSGKIIQTGDFLDGQAFDPQKFSVEITYDNGTIAPADSAVSVRLVDQGGKAEAGARLEALIGYDVYGDPVYAEGSLSAYMIKSVSVTGPSSYVNTAVPKASDLTVTATYLDSKNAEKTMVLGSDEFRVTGVVYANNNIGPNASQTSVDAVATVKPVVGQGGTTGVAPVTGEFAFTATFEAAELPVIEEIVAVSFKNGTEIPAWIYDGVPAPSFDDLVVRVQYAGKDYEDGGYDTLTSDPGFELEYVDATSYETITTDDFRNMTSVRVAYTYGDFSGITTNSAGAGTATVKAPALTVAPLTGVSFVKESKLAAPDASDYVVTVEINNDIQFITEGVEFAFSATEVTDASATITVPETVGENLYIVATYRGIRNSGDLKACLVEKGTPVVEEITAVTFKDELDLPNRAYYTDTNLTALKPAADDVVSVTVQMNDGTTKVLTSESTTKFELDTTAYYLSADEDDKVSEDNKNIETIKVGEDTYYDVNADELFVKVTVGEVTEFFSVDTEASEVKAITATPVYTYVLDGDEPAPMLDSPITWTAVTYDSDSTETANVIDPAYAASNWVLVVDGVEVANKTVTVGAEAKSYNAYTTLNNTGFVQMTTPGSISEGEGYVDVTRLAAEIGTSFDRLVGKEITTYSKDAYTVTGYEVKGGADDPGIVVAEPTGKVVVAGNNTVRLSFTYTSKEGDTDAVLYVTTATFQGLEHVEPADDGFVLLATIDGEEEEFSGSSGTIPAASYRFSDFSLDPESYVPYWTRQTSDLLSISAEITRAEADPDAEPEAWTTGSKALAEGDAVKFTITYVDETYLDSTDADKKPSTQEITITVGPAADGE